MFFVYFNVLFYIIFIFVASFCFIQYQTVLFTVIIYYIFVCTRRKNMAKNILRKKRKTFPSAKKQHKSPQNHFMGLRQMLSDYFGGRGKLVPFESGCSIWAERVWLRLNPKVVTMPSKLSLKDTRRRRNWFLDKQEVQGSDIYVPQGLPKWRKGKSKGFLPSANILIVTKSGNQIYLAEQYEPSKKN